MKRIRLALLASVLVAASSAAGKGKQSLNPCGGGPANEDQIVREIRWQLVTLPYYSVFDELRFTVDGGRITLFGQVVQPVLKEEAGHAVKQVEGVTNVINNLKVLPPSPNDERIRRAEYEAIYGDPALSKGYAYKALAQIHIIVSQGDVRLEGFVVDNEDRTLAQDRANAVPGVSHVDNDLKLELSSHPLTIHGLP
jgi:BON domain